MLGIAAGTLALARHRDLNSERARSAALEREIEALQRRLDAADAPFAGTPGCLPGAEREATAPDLPAEEHIDLIARRVEHIRGLSFEVEVEPTFLPPRRVAGRAARLLSDEYPRRAARAEEIILVALGAIPEDTDLRDTLLELLETQVAGFYVPETQEMVVPRDEPGARLRPDQAMTLAHELEHALAHQVLGLPIRQDPFTEDADGAVASLALVEGDATLTMQHYAALHVPPQDQLLLLVDPRLTQARDALESAPHYLVRSLAFPYDEGLNFACTLYAHENWAAIDAAYDSPPSTTAQVLFPDRYARRERPVSPRRQSRPDDGWRLRHRTTIGAANLMWLFQAPGGEPAKAIGRERQRARAWDGGEVALFTKDGEAAVGMALVQRDGEGDLCASIEDWYRAVLKGAQEAETVAAAERFALDHEDRAAVLKCPGDEVRLGVAPDLDTARDLVN